MPWPPSAEPAMCQPPLAICTHRILEESPLLTALTVAGLALACLIKIALWFAVVLLFGKSTLLHDVNNPGRSVDFPNRCTYMRKQVTMRNGMSDR